MGDCPTVYNTISLLLLSRNTSPQVDSESLCQRLLSMVSQGNLLEIETRSYSIST